MFVGSVDVWFFLKFGKFFVFSDISSALPTQLGTEVELKLPAGIPQLTDALFMFVITPPGHSPRVISITRARKVNRQKVNN